MTVRMRKADVEVGDPQGRQAPWREGEARPAWRSLLLDAEAKHSETHSHPAGSIAHPDEARAAPRQREPGPRREAAGLGRRLLAVDPCWAHWCPAGPIGKHCAASFAHASTTTVSRARPAHPRAAPRASPSLLSIARGGRALDSSSVAPDARAPPPVPSAAGPRGRAERSLRARPPPSLPAARAIPLPAGFAEPGQTYAPLTCRRPFPAIPGPTDIAGNGFVVLPAKEVWPMGNHGIRRR